MIVDTVVMLQDNGRADDAGSMTGTMANAVKMVEVVVKGRNEGRVGTIGTTFLWRRIESV